MKISVHIERLVLDGLPLERRDGPIVRAAVERELAHLFNADAPAPRLLSSNAVPSLRAASIELQETVSPKQLGQQIAKAVHGSLDDL
jgi:hypothetical protein